MDKPLVSIVITTWNRRDDLRRTLLELRAQDYPCLETIVVDNGSRDGTLGLLIEEFKWVRTIPLSENMGIEGTNIGMREATGEYILLLDNDSFPKEDAVRRMVDVFNNDERIGVVAFQIHGQGYNHTSKLPSSPVDVYGFSGGGAGIRRAILKEVGEFPKEYFLYLCEQDLSIRILNAGYRIVHCPEIIVYHRTSPISRNYRDVAYYYTRNIVYLLFRYYPLREVCMKVAKLIFMAFYASIEQFTPLYIRAIFDAIRSIKGIQRYTGIKRDVLKRVRISLGLVFTFYR